MKRKLLAAAVVTLFAATAWSQGYGPGYGMGPGMMGGYGYGAGTGPGMMSGFEGGPGYGMGPGMMGGYGGAGLAALNLSADQRKQIAQIQEETAQARWKLMGAMHQQGFHMYNQTGPQVFDEDAARKSFDVMAGAQRAMFETSLAARKRIDAVLTKEQRDQLRRGAGAQ